jgi:uncharacterized protein (TIGR00369 family)
MLSHDEHYRRLERMYVRAPINAYFAPTLLVAERRAEVTIGVRPDFFHAAHALHGSVYFKALDDAAFFAANSVVMDVFVLTVSYEVVLLRPVSSGTIHAVGRLIHESRSLLVGEAELRNEAGELLARGSGTFVRSTIALDSDVGYA